MDALEIYWLGLGVGLVLAGVIMYLIAVWPFERRRKG